MDVTSPNQYITNINKEADTTSLATFFPRHPNPLLASLTSFPSENMRNNIQSKKDKVIFLSRNVLDERQKMKEHHKALKRKYKKLERDGNILKLNKEMKEIRALLKNNHNRNKEFLSNIDENSGLNCNGKMKTSTKSNSTSNEQVRTWAANVLLFDTYMKDVSDYSEMKTRLNDMKNNHPSVHIWVCNIKRGGIKIDMLQRQTDLKRIRFFEIMSLSKCDERIKQLEHFYHHIDRNLSKTNGMKKHHIWAQVHKWKENTLEKFRKGTLVFTDEQVRRLAKIGFFYKYGTYKKVISTLVSSGLFYNFY